MAPDVYEVLSGTCQQCVQTYIFYSPGHGSQIHWRPCPPSTADPATDNTPFVVADGTGNSGHVRIGRTAQ